MAGAGSLSKPVREPHGPLQQPAHRVVVGIKCDDICEALPVMFGPEYHLNKDFPFVFFIVFASLRL